MEIEEDSYDEWVEDDGDPEDDVLACPACRRLVHEDTQQCPHCGDWIVPVDPRERSKKLFATVVILMLVAGMILLTVF